MWTCAKGAKSLYMLVSFILGAMSRTEKMDLSELIRPLWDGWYCIRKNVARGDSLVVNNWEAQIVLRWKACYYFMEFVFLGALQFKNIKNAQWFLQITHWKDSQWLLMTNYPLFSGSVEVLSGAIRGGRVSAFASWLCYFTFHHF